MLTESACSCALYHHDFACGIRVSIFQVSILKLDRMSPCLGCQPNLLSGPAHEIIVVGPDFRNDFYISHYYTQTLRTAILLSDLPRYKLHLWGGGEFSLSGFWQTRSRCLGFNRRERIWAKDSQVCFSLPFSLALIFKSILSTDKRKLENMVVWSTSLVTSSPQTIFNPEWCIAVRYSHSR